MLSSTDGSNPVFGSQDYSSQQGGRGRGAGYAVAIQRMGITPVQVQKGFASEKTTDCKLGFE